RGGESRRYVSRWRQSSRIARVIARVLDVRLDRHGQALARDAKGCARRGVVPTCRAIRAYAGLEFRPMMDANFKELKARATVSALERGRVHEVPRARHRSVRPRCCRGGRQPGVAVAGAKAQRERTNH